MISARHQSYLMMNAKSHFGILRYLPACYVYNLVYNLCRSLLEQQIGLVLFGRARNHGRKFPKYSRTSFRGIVN